MQPANKPGRTQLMLVPVTLPPRANLHALFILHKLKNMKRVVWACLRSQLCHQKDLSSGPNPPPIPCPCSVKNKYSSSLWLHASMNLAGCWYAVLHSLAIEEHQAHLLDAPAGPASASPSPPVKVNLFASHTCVCSAQKSCIKYCLTSC